MNGTRRTPLTRRSFIGGLALLPLFLSQAVADDALPPSQASRRLPPVTSADQILNVMQLEELAREALPPAHFGYIATS